MRRHKRKRPQTEEVTLNLAAMLDMAFQLLAFFILTFKPNPVEGQINLNLPPPKPVAPPTEVNAQNDDQGNGPTSAKTLTITIAASGNGQVASITVGLAELFKGPLDPQGARLKQLDRRLKDVFSIEGTFDQVLLRIGKTLNYGELMKVIDICTKQKMADGKPVNKISFVELESK